MRCKHILKPVNTSDVQYNHTLQAGHETHVPTGNTLSTLLVHILVAASILAFVFLQPNVCGRNYRFVPKVCVLFLSFVLILKLCLHQVLMSIDCQLELEYSKELGHFHLDTQIVVPHPPCRMAEGLSEEVE